MCPPTEQAVPLNVLFLEDSERDMQLVKATLDRDSGPFRMRWARDRDEYLAALAQPDLDLVLSDFALNGYDGLNALRACRERHPNLPFILVSGFVGEETAVECLRQGATDYVSKGNLQRLPLVLLRAMAEVRERTARVRSEAVKAALLRAATLAKVVPWRRDPATRAWVFEDSATAVLGFTPQEFQGDPDLVERLIHREDVHRFVSAQAATGSGKPVDFHCRMTHKSGDRLWTRWTLAMADGLLQGVLQDVSELHSTQNQLVQSQKGEVASILVSGLCHDFNNLIAAIAGCATALGLEGLSAEQREALGAIHQATERSKDLVRQLLDFARKNREPRKVLRSLNSLVQEAATLLSHVRADGARLQTDLDPCRSEAWVEPGQIVQVLMNLGMNAFDALEGPGTITLRTGRHPPPVPGEGCRPPPQGSYAFLEVEDTGCGIPPDQQAKIFDPFYTTKPPGQGTGLGLAMAQAIVKEHDGEIQCHSEPGRGTRFRILLPAAQQAAAQPQPESGLEAAQPRPLTVLLADDDEAFRTSWARAIRKAFRWQVLEAKDGLEAVELFRTHQGTIDLVILDRRMPELSGPEAFAAIRRIRPGTAGLLCSADAGESMGTSARDLGFQVFLRKPFTLRDLESALRELGR